jgi:hypothetical protein
MENQQEEEENQETVAQLPFQKQSKPKKGRRSSGWNDEKHQNDQKSPVQELMELDHKYKVGAAPITENVRTVGDSNEEGTYLFFNIQVDAVIPDLQESNEDLVNPDIAAPPSVKISRTLTLRELERELDHNSININVKSPG